MESDSGDVDYRTGAVAAAVLRRAEVFRRRDHRWSGEGMSVMHCEARGLLIDSVLRLRHRVADARATRKCSSACPGGAATKCIAPISRRSAGSRRSTRTSR